VAKESASKVLSIGGKEVQITNPEKLYFSSQVKVTKLELVQYYLSVAPGALAGIALVSSIDLRYCLIGDASGRVLEEV
jgi:bifunctional non-homologous end joining protein LigD